MYGLYAATEWKISGMFHKKGDFSLWINRDIVGEDSLKKKKLFWETVKIPQKNKINKLKNFETGIKEKTPSLSH